MSNGQATTYRFMELTQQHQVALLRQQVLNLEQQLYGLALQEEALALRKAQAVDELERLQAKVQRILQPPQEAPEVEPGSIVPLPEAGPTP
jgi:hypothetical protein